MRMSRPADPHIALLRALRAEFDRLAMALILESDASAPWASATFVGMRHEFRFASEAPVAGHAIAALVEVEFRLPGHLVADILVAPSDGGLDVEALTIEAC